MQETTPEVIVGTPLKYGTVSRPYTFGDGICIRKVAPILWDSSIAKHVISRHERSELEGDRYWLCAVEEMERATETDGDHLYRKARHAMWALQIICPSGGKNLYLKFVKTDAGYDNISTDHPKELRSALIGRVTYAENCGLESWFDVAYAGVRRSFNEKVTRLQNPILLIEHSMQIASSPLGNLMAVMALDMLMMAGEKVPFIERLGGFLGPNSYVFPPDSIMNRQPAVKVRDVISDVCKFRNIIAHGQHIPEKPYRQKHDLLDVNGQRINRGDYHYHDLLQEGSLFMLTTALRTVFVKSLFDDVADEKKWREELRVCEQRWKAVKETGRSS